jgi:laminin beta 1
MIIICSFIFVYVLACDCDDRGSLDDGICDSRTDLANDFISGRCHCKKNVDGRRCDKCMNGFWNFNKENPEGCQRKLILKFHH